MTPSSNTTHSKHNRHHHTYTPSIATPPKRPHQPPKTIQHTRPRAYTSQRNITTSESVGIPVLGNAHTPLPPSPPPAHHFGYRVHNSKASKYTQTAHTACGCNENLEEASIPNEKTDETKEEWLGRLCNTGQCSTNRDLFFLGKSLRSRFGGCAGAVGRE
ncbi:hypothetical protein T440DRAFT_245234 [Plenodomus tracheiphilus IPT5]|uniref:Uncharacterized protein n=1 Tax=Plenodomus tracheiphilus IPT5 TaxID=1408161 RepID=A0A6A7BJC6_9PLEO|nr:hypothetical protein T440DRAFT_245234 [Plenodomus tracheiphilus IPT5]